LTLCDYNVIIIIEIERRPAKWKSAYVLSAITTSHLRAMYTPFAPISAAERPEAGAGVRSEQRPYGVIATLARSARRRIAASKFTIKRPFAKAEITLSSIL
jgi:hypothetical protein